MKKTIILLAFLAGILPAFPSVQIGDLFYNLNAGNKTAEVTYQYKNDDNQNYVSGELTIPETLDYEGTIYSVTSIGNMAFYGCKGLTGVEIPNSITSIGYYAFEYCSGLTGVVIPNSVTSIGENTFYYCTALTSVEIPNSVNSIGTNAFYNCIGLVQIILDHDTPPSYYSPFSSFAKKATLTIPDTADLNAYLLSDWRNFLNIEQTNGDKIFFDNDGVFEYRFIESLGQAYLVSSPDYSGLTSASIPDRVAIDREGVESFYQVTGIFENAFKDCSNLTKVKLPSNCEYVGKNAFSGCSSLTSLDIPNSVTSIGEKAFLNCEFENFTLEDGLEELQCNDENPIVTKNLYLGRTISGAVSFSQLESLEVSGFVEALPAKCFKDNELLESVVINPGSGLVIEDGAFQGCISLAEITLPEDIAEIGANAFSGTALKNITVPNGIIGANAFANCNLDKIILGAGVESIGEKAFDGSNSINAVYATPITPPAAENNTFSYYEAQLYVPAKSIETYSNYTPCWYRFSVQPLVLPDGIEVEGPPSITGEVGDTIQLFTTITPSNVTLDRVLWHSTNPAIASVDNNGLVTIHNFTTDGSKAKAANTVSCQIIATTLYADSPVAMVTIEAGGENNAVEYINSDNFNGTGQQGTAPNDIFTLQGVCLKRNASQSDIDALTPGIYIIAGRKVVVK